MLDQLAGLEVTTLLRLHYCGRTRREAAAFGAAIAPAWGLRCRDRKEESGDYVLAVHVDAGQNKARAGLSQEIEGYRVKYISSGPFRKLKIADKP